MTFEIFVTILVISSVATSIGVEIIKNLFEVAERTYKSVIVAIIVAMAVGIAEIFIYYLANGIPVAAITFVYAVCMGVANSLGATTSYDLVKKFIVALKG